MQAISNEKFLSWASSREIVADMRYSPPQCLTYLPNRPHHRFWIVPERAAALPFFVEHLLAGMDPWSECYLWPRGGRWLQSNATDRMTDRVRDNILTSAGVPLGFEGAVRYSDAETHKLVTAIFAQLVFGWSVVDDLFVVPDHGRQFLQTDHHDVVHVCFADEKQIEPFIAHMAGEKYLLPDEPPDATFKKPDWMS
jgi:hypothetical protein